MGQTKCECEGFSERNRVAAGSQREEPHYRRDYAFTPWKITKRKRSQGPACDSFRRVGQSGSRGKPHREFGPVAANSASTYANWDTLRMASSHGQTWHEALDAPTPARVAIYSFRGLTRKNHHLKESTSSLRVGKAVEFFAYIHSRCRSLHRSQISKDL